MTIQNARLTSPPVEIAVADTPSVLSKINTAPCIATVWRRQPLSSFQTWLDDLDVAVLPQARLILPAEAVNDALTHVCRQAGMPNCPERAMLAGDIAALAHMFCDVALCDYLRVRLTVLNGDPSFTQQEIENGRRLICVYRGPRLAIGQAASEMASYIPVSNGVPFIMRRESSSSLRSNILRCRVLPSDGAPLTSLVLALDPVSASERTPDLKAKRRH